VDPLLIGSGIFGQLESRIIDPDLAPDPKPDPTLFEIKYSITFEHLYLNFAQIVVE
jgi:hypothetical protein